MWKCNKCHSEIEVSIRTDKDSIYKLGKRGYKIGKPSMTITYNNKEKYICKRCGNVSERSVKAIGYWEEQNKKIICIKNDLINYHKIYCEITDLLDKNSEHKIDDVCHHYLVECKGNLLIRFPGCTVGKISLKDKRVIKKIEIYKYFYEKFDENKIKDKNKLLEINELLNDNFAGKILIFN